MTLPFYYLNVLNVAALVGYLTCFGTYSTFYCSTGSENSTVTSGCLYSDFEIIFGEVDNATDLTD
jgi:hypothetical protein